MQSAEGRTVLKVKAGLDAIDAGSQERPMADAQQPSLSPIRTGLACRCPRCGKGRLFQGFLNLRPDDGLEAGDVRRRQVG